MAKPEPESTTVGARVRTARNRLRLRRRRVARNAGLSRRELAAFERGNREMSVYQVRSVAGSLGVDVDELISADELNDNPGASELRIEDVLEVPADLGGLESLPPAPPLPELAEEARRVERRKVPLARATLDEAFNRVRHELDDVTQAADRMQAIGSEDDVRALVYELQRALSALRENRGFEAALAKFDEARAAYNDTMANHSLASWQTRRADG